MKIEKDWKTEAGLRAVVVATDMGHRCGYVAVTRGHATFGKDYYEVTVDVHGGLTYSEIDNYYPVKTEASEVWWFGFDCAHHGDLPDPSLRSYVYRSAETEGVVRTLDYCVQECESLAKQLENLK